MQTFPPLTDWPDWRTLALRGVAALAFGILTLIWPGVTLWVLVVLFGAYALVDGVFTLIDVGRNRPGTAEHRGWLIVEALAGIAAGIVTFVWPAITALALLFVIAAWAFVIGVARVSAAIKLRHILDHAWLMGIAGILSIVFAILLVITPGAGALVITWLIGWWAVVVGVTLLTAAWRIHRRAGVRDARHVPIGHAT
ncbi:MAG TPA: HdeD family acid-resistance protein [Acidimicrobiia bacterium]|nr:HdeD family acid-resistance protein [Acidimicrobiia bacterium]